MHLDASVGNLVVRDDGQIYVIDFEKACIDGVADSHKLHKRLHKMRIKGGLTYLVNIYEEMLLTVCT
jgi:predicted Ser/Thr protein kinase